MALSFPRGGDVEVWATGDNIFFPSLCGVSIHIDIIIQCANNVLTLEKQEILDIFSFHDYFFHM